MACTDTGGFRHEVRDTLHDFYRFCADCSVPRVPEIRTLAATVSDWQEPMLLAIETCLSNARSEGNNW